LSGVELQDRGDFRALKTVVPDNTGDPEMAAFVWMDRERRYFIATAGSLAAGRAYTRARWRQIIQDRIAPPEKVNLTITQPEIAEIYYDTCGAIDRHNRCRQDDLCIEKKVQTINWSTRVNLSIFGMIVVDSWLVYKALVDAPGQKIVATEDSAFTQSGFYSCLAEQLVLNNYNEKGRPSAARRRSFEEEACLNAVKSGSPKSGVLAHLTPIKRFKTDQDGRETSFRYQGRCRECQIKTTWTCSDCEEQGKNVYLCSTKNGKRCFVQHIAKHHTNLGDVNL
jgi:hypothetical protein